MALVVYTACKSKAVCTRLHTSDFLGRCTESCICHTFVTHSVLELAGAKTREMRFCVVLAKGGGLQQPQQEQQAKASCHPDLREALCPQEWW